MPEENNNAKLDNSKGFKFNIHNTRMDYFIDFPLIKFLSSNGRYQIKFKDLLLAMIGLAIIGVTFVGFLANNTIRAQYIWLPLTLIAIGLLGFLYMQVLTEPSVGSMNKVSFILLKSLVNQYKVKNGKKRDEFTGINKVDDSIIYFSNKKVAKLYKLDGKTSNVSYPSELLAQEAQAKAYQRVRKYNAYEIKITSSELQNARVQMNNLERKINNFYENPALNEIATIQYNNIKKNINGVSNTIVQYLMIVSDNKKNLKDYCDKVENSNLYYSMIELNDDKIKRVLGAILNFKSIE